MKFIEELEKSGQIPAYDVAEDYGVLLDLPESKPSKRIITKKKSFDSLVLLGFIKKNKNHSWYNEIYDRNKENLDGIALFYRGNKITYRETFKRVDELASAMLNAGINPGDEIPCCLANTPELVYVMLAASKIGARLNLFGSNYNKEYISEILDGCSSKLMFITDNCYEEIQDVVKARKIDNKILISLADSLPEDPTKCDEYVPELDHYYHYENKATGFAQDDSSITLFGDFLNIGRNNPNDYVHPGKLNDLFTVTYTSGSTRIGHPSAMYHANRSYIVGGIFNTSKLTGTPTIQNVRTLAHIHSDSNTNLITSISDTLMKGATVAMEPEYSKESALDVMFINNPVLYTGTPSHLIEAAKQYLISRRFNNGESKRTLGRQLVTIAVGEKKTMGEEKFINLFLRKAKAGSEVEVIMDNGFKLKIPYGPMSFGGGDTEHGGLFYTLQLLFKRIRYAYKGKNFDYGMDAVPFAVVTALKKNENGEWVECDYNEKGIIVANSITNMLGYKGDIAKTKSKIIRDNLGRDWLTCDVYGYINDLGNPIFLGREEDNVVLKNGSKYPLYRIDEIVAKDTKNILSTTTISINGILVINIEFNPLKKGVEEKAIRSLQRRFMSLLPPELYNRIYIRIIDNEYSYPLTGSGKRNVPALVKMGMDNTFQLSEYEVKEKQEAQGFVKIKKL